MLCGGVALTVESGYFSGDIKLGAYKNYVQENLTKNYAMWVSAHYKRNDDHVSPLDQGKNGLDDGSGCVSTS